MFALCPNKGTFYVDVYRCSKHTVQSKFITRSRATDLSTAIRNIAVSLSLSLPPHLTKVNDNQRRGKRRKKLIVFSDKFMLIRKLQIFSVRGIIRTLHPFPRRTPATMYNVWRDKSIINGRTLVVVVMKCVHLLRCRPFAAHSISKTT